MILAQRIVPVLILLHGATGNEIIVNTNEIVSMREGDGVHNQYVTQGVRCVINTTDGKFISVAETCSDIVEAAKESSR